MYTLKFKNDGNYKVCKWSIISIIIKQKTVALFELRISLPEKQQVTPGKKITPLRFCPSARNFSPYRAGFRPQFSSRSPPHLHISPLISARITPGLRPKRNVKFVLGRRKINMLRAKLVFFYAPITGEIFHTGLESLTLKMR